MTGNGQLVLSPEPPLVAALRADLACLQRELAAAHRLLRERDEEIRRLRETAA